MGPYRRDSTLGPAQWRNITSKLIVHPNFNDNTLENDYLMFKIEAVTKKNLKPIKLNKSKTNPVVNQTLTTIGMSVMESGAISNCLKKVSISTVSYSACRTALAVEQSPIIDEIMIYATSTGCKSAFFGASNSPKVFQSCVSLNCFLPAD